MLEKERPVNFRDPAEKGRSLWTYDDENRVFRNVITTEKRVEEPEQCLGGILAGMVDLEIH